MLNNSKKAFTLIELLIVVAVIAILAVVSFTALDPQKRFRDSRDSVRYNDVTSILDAVKLHQVDNNGVYLDTIDNLALDIEYMIGNATTSANCNKSCDVSIGGAECVNLNSLVVNGYLGEFPVSPVGGSVDWTATHSGYYLTKNQNGSVTVGACESENQSEIKVTK